MHWLDAPAENLLGDVFEAKALSGENLDGSKPSVRYRVLDEIRSAQAAIRTEAHLMPDGRVMVHRAMVLNDDALTSLSPGDALGESWAFDERGAHPYDATRKGLVITISALVDPEDIVGPHVLAMWSSGEGELA